jgi:hypothetical protein
MMTVSSIVTHRRRPARGTAAARRMERLGRLDADAMHTGLAFLAGFRPAVFDAVLDAAEPGELGPCRDPEPFCTECHANAGIFWLLGDEWQHYRPGADPDGKPEVYDPGHTPVIGWRTPAADAPLAP